jgi:hypothetical protein
MSDAPTNGTPPPNGTTTNGHDPSGGPGVSRIPVMPPSLSDRERELQINMLERQLQRQDALVENFYAFSRNWIGNQIDPRRNLFTECGYPENPTIDMYRNLYEREPLATRAVEVYPKECWQQPPTVFEDMDVDKVTDFEQAWDNLTNDLRTEASFYQDEQGSAIWDELQRADILSRIGSYGVILLGIDDGKNLQEPLDGVMVLNERNGQYGQRPPDGIMLPEEEHRLLNPVGRWKATDVENLEHKEYIHSGPDRVGESPLSRNQLYQVEQWKWERTYRERGHTPELATNAAKEKVLRKMIGEGNAKIQHANPCPACHKSWPVVDDPQDNGGACHNCGEQVPVVNVSALDDPLTENIRTGFMQVWAKSPAQAAKLVQNQVYMERGWWPKIVSVKVLNANPNHDEQGRFAGEGSEESLKQHERLKVEFEGNLVDVSKNPTKQGLTNWLSAPGMKDIDGNTRPGKQLKGVVDEEGNTFVWDALDEKGDDLHHNDVAGAVGVKGHVPFNRRFEVHLKEGEVEFHTHSGVDSSPSISKAGKRLGVTVNDHSNNSSFQEVHWDGTTNDNGQYDSRDATRTHGSRNPNNDEQAPTERAKPLNPNQKNPVDAGAIKPGQRKTFDPTKGPAQRQGDFAEVFGTDQQYDDEGYGIGMPPPAAELGYSLSGTDEQYFGVQFGPSEQPAPPTDPATAWPSDGGAADQDGQSQGPKRLRPRLLFMRPYSEDLVQVVRYEWNIRNPRFGYPVMYRITLNDPRETQGGVGLPLATVFVHWSRVIHLCDRTKCGGVSSNPVFTIPALKPVFNSILDAQKVCGAGAEGYYSSCFTGLQYVTHPSMGGDVFLDQDKTMGQFQDYRNNLTRGLVSIGGEWKTIAPSVVDPTPHYNLAVEKICIVLGCPVRIFKGSERGEMASSQDDESWNKRRLERQVNYITPRVIVPLIDRLIQVGVLPVPGQKSGKQQVQNILKRQPQARASRINGGWLVTNVYKRVKTMNSNPFHDEAGRFTYAADEGGGGGGTVKKQPKLSELIMGVTGPKEGKRKKKNSTPPPSPQEVARSKYHQLFNGQAMPVNPGEHLVSQIKGKWFVKMLEVDKGPEHDVGEFLHGPMFDTKHEAVEYGNQHVKARLRSLKEEMTANIVSPSVGDHASRVAQALTMDKDNMQRPGDAKDQQARTGQAGGPDAWSKPLTGPDGKPLDDEFERPPVDDERTENRHWDEDVLNANPNHDEKGRFSESDSSTHDSNNVFPGVFPKKMTMEDVKQWIALGRPLHPMALKKYPELAEMLPKGPKFTSVVKDVTPDGYAPSKSTEGSTSTHSADRHQSTEEQSLRRSLAEAQTLLKGNLHADKRKQVEATIKDTQDKLEDIRVAESIASKGGGRVSNSFSQEVHWDGTPVENAKPKVKKAPSIAGSGDATPSDDYTSQPDSIGPADPAATEVQPGNFPHDSPRLNPGYDPPETGFSHATGAAKPTNGPNAGPAESKSRFENTSRYGADSDITGDGTNPAQDTGGGWGPPTSSDSADGGAAPWETGQTGIMAGAGKPSSIFVADGGYSVEWPDIEAVSKKDKAGIALSYTQALQAYVQGGVEATMPFKEYLVHIWGWEEELAQEMIEAAKALHDPDGDDEPLTTPKMISGQPAEAADGTQAAADADTAADQAKQQLDLKGQMMSQKMGAFGGKGGVKSGTMKPVTAAPNKQDMKVASTAKADAAASNPVPGDEK